MSWIDREGKRHLTQEDIALANMMADRIFERLSSKLENRISTTEATKVPSSYEAAVLLKENFKRDFEKLSYLPPSCLRVFYFIFANGPSHIHKIRQELKIQGKKRMPLSTIYYALSKLKENGLFEVVGDKWRINAKGFLPFCS